MLKLHNKPTELKSLTGVIHAALAEKLEKNDATSELTDSIAAILAYQKATDETKRAIDEVIGYITRKPFALLMRECLESVKSQQKFCEKFVEAVGLAGEVFQKDWY